MGRRLAGVALFLLGTFLLYMALATAFLFPGELEEKAAPSFALLVASMFVFWCWYRVDFGGRKVSLPFESRPEFEEIATRFLILLFVSGVVIAGIIWTFSSLHVRFG